MLANTFLRFLCLISTCVAAPFNQASSASQLSTLDKRADFAEWGVGANWQITNAGTFFATFDNGVKFAFQNDGNFVVYDKNGKALWSSQTAGHTCNGDPNGNCLLTFQGDGNFVLYVNGSPKWNTKSGGKGASLLLQDTKPYIAVYDASGNYVYTSGGAPRVPDPRDPGGAEGGGGGGGGGGLGTLCETGKCVIVYPI